MVMSTMLFIGLAVADAAWQMCAIAFIAFGVSTAALVREHGVQVAVIESNKVSIFASSLSSGFSCSVISPKMGNFSSRSLAWLPLVNGTVAS